MSQAINWLQWEQRFLRFLARQNIQVDPAHDLAHIRRVVANAQRLAMAEGAQLEIVLPAAWLHDCVIVPKDTPARHTASAQAAHAAGAFLHTQGFPAHYIPAIEHAIEAHSFSAGIHPRTLEAQVVQDADRLDALGAIGIARCLLLGGAMGTTLYHTHEPLPITRPPDDTAYVIDHFYRKLLTLADMMHTPTGRAEARKRTAFMRQFLAQLGHEIDGIR